MKRIAILIATTGGPVLVERITPEPAPQSMVCLNRQSDVLPISADYDDFVRAGSGVIMREFGPYKEESFRLDVSAAIETGQSWQLGVYAAHAVFKANECELTSIEKADLIVWLTGTVDNDLNVGDVDHIAEKVEASAHVLADAIAKKKEIIFATGVENAKFLQEHEPPEGVRFVSLTNAKGLLDQMGIQKQVEAAKRGTFGFWTMAVVAFFAVGTVVFFDRFANPKGVEINIFSDRGEHPIYRFDEDLSLIARVNRDSWLVCLYQQADGKEVQIYPNDIDKGVFKLLPNQDVTLSGSGKGEFVIRLGPPAGDEQVTCYAHEDRFTADSIPQDAAQDTMRITLKP